jgi:hypothetical protein
MHQQAFSPPNQSDTKRAMMARVAIADFGPAPRMITGPASG